MDRDDTILDYLQGRLSPKDRQQFEHAMSQDNSLSSEVDLMRAVRAELAAGPSHEYSAAVWDKVSASIDATPIPANQNQRPWVQALRYAAVASVAIAAWQLAIVPRMNARPDGFRTASEQSANFIVQVKFAQDATVGEISAVLVPVGGTITDGPSALNLFRISFPDQTSREKALNTLQSRNDIVEMVAEQ
ncbi:MAG: hypothetical protein ABJG75_13525 [Roseobacter sp.]